VHWYGQETIDPAFTFALASTSPEYDAAATGVPRERLREMAVQSVRYLCFTHDTGPAECVRPATGLGRPENCGTKWGERGRGFFRESQCGRTTASLAAICLLLRDHVDDETWQMAARIQKDYLERFGEMPPKSGVYWDTQMEENAWTSHGLTGAALFLERHPRASEWEATLRRWMFSTCAAPQDAKDRGAVGNTTTTAAALAGRTFTTLPDYWAENHGMVHPTYTASGVRSLLTCGTLLRLWGRDLLPELFWNRQRIYDTLKPLTDGGGYPQAVQGMDWHYLPTAGNETCHAIASVFFGDPDAAALQRRALRYAELRQAGNGGRMYSEEIARAAHDQQDPMVMREMTVGQNGALYLFHRLFGPGAEPTPDDLLDPRLAGVRVYPHAGFAHHRHGVGQTSFSWRNSVMALPLPRDGIYTVAPASDTFLGTPRVQGRPDSHRLVSVRVAEYDAAFAAALMMDRCQDALRQEVLFASLPDGRVLSFERFVARQDVVVEALDQGTLRVTNEYFPSLAPLTTSCRGARILYRPGGATEYRGGIGASDAEDTVDDLGQPGWLNVDDRLGIRFAGTGRAVYHNRRFFKPYRAIADDLVLSRADTPASVRAGETAASLAAVVCLEQPHDGTLGTTLHLVAQEDGVCLATDGYLAAANFATHRRICRFDLPRPAAVPVCAGATVEATEATGHHIRVDVSLEAGTAALFPVQRTVRASAPVRIAAAPDGSAYVTNLGASPTAVDVIEAGQVRETRHLAPGEIARI
jgi:hypothetical protein